MRFLFTVQLAPSHLRPMVPVAWALVAAGHQVVVACPPNMVEGPRSLGLSVVGYGRPHDPVSTIRARRDARHHTIGGRVALTKYAGIARGLAAAAEIDVAPLLSFVRAWRPAAIIHEPTDLPGRIAAAATGTPSYRHRWGVDTFGPVFDDAACVALDTLCTALGFDSTRLRECSYIDPCPDEMQMPDVPIGRPMRYVSHNGTGTLPDWTFDPAPPLPRVSVTLGTLTAGLDGTALLTTVFDALDGMPVEVIAAIAPAEANALGSLPDNVRPVVGMPIDFFTPSCSAAINHGGSGSVFTPLAAGVPQLVMPQLLHEFETGDALSRIGAGTCLDTAEQQQDPSRIRQSVEMLIDDPTYRCRADELAAANNARPDPTTIAAELVHSLI